MMISNPTRRHVRAIRDAVTPECEFGGLAQSNDPCQESKISFPWNWTWVKRKAVELRRTVCDFVASLSPIARSLLIASNHCFDRSLDA
jgi:hypothetical protein